MTAGVDLAAVKARAEAATEGPWVLGAEVSRDLGIINAHWFGSADPETGGILGEAGRADAEFIAHARADVPALVAEVERLRGLVTVVRDTVEEARQASMRGEVWVVSELGFNVLAAIDGASS